MKTLKELSEMPREQIKVIDKGAMYGFPLTWKDHIIIMYDGLSQTHLRSTVFPFGLCDGVPKKKSGGFREGSGRKPLPKGEKKSPITIQVEDKIISEFGGKDRLKKILYNCIKQRI